MSPTRPSSDSDVVRARESSAYDVAVVGAGITGLACAWTLRQAGLRVVVLEADARVGGCIETVRRDDGFRFECGPHTVRGADEDLLTHLDEIGLGEEVVELKGASHRYILRQGRLVPLPSSPPGFIRSPFLSPAAKLRVLAEPFVGPLRDDDPSLGAFVGHRLGAGVREGPLDAFVGGIWAGDPDRISARAAFPSVVEGVDRHGSLLRWALARRRTRTEARCRRGTPGIFSLSGGLSRWPQMLAAGLPAQDLRTGVRAVQLSWNEDRWTVGTESSAGPASVEAPHVVLTGGPEETARLAGRWLSPAVRQGLETMRSASLAVVHLGYDARSVDEPPQGFGVLIPRGERRRCLGILFVSSILPERAPEGALTTTTFVGGIRDQAQMEKNDDELVELAHREHVELLGFRDPPRVSHVRRWRGVLPQYEAGHHRLVSAIEEQEKRRPTLHLAGRFRGGVSVPDCWRRGLELGGRLAGGAAGIGDTLPRPSQPSTA